ncbi:MAG: polyketide synthase, partial [Myxococcota bacterium]
MSVEPIAIVGQGCALPGAMSPEALWDAVVSRRSLLGPVPEGRWGVAPHHIMGTHGSTCVDRTWSDRGGYVRDDRDRPERGDLRDPLVRWLLHAGRQALGSVEPRWRPERAGLVVGNLSFPSASMARFAERTWLGDPLADRLGVPAPGAQARFMSGLPAYRIARELGLKGPVWALDAACASSLYAIKLACDRLHDGGVDLMVAGAVNAADDLFLHVGFCALQALSPSGQSRPFHAEADGLVPAEGAGLVVLKRLRDAERHGDMILGVIRGVGLSNDEA